MQASQAVNAALHDIINGARNWHLWIWLGWKDTRLRYRRTVIGPFWQTLSMAIFIGALGYLYSQFWRMPIHEFIPFLTAGMTAWILISTVITEGTGIFVSSTPFIMQKGMPYSTFVYQMIYRNVIVFFHNLIVFFIVMFIFDVPLTVYTFLMLPGLLLIVLNGIWISLLLGSFCTRFRDFSNLIISILQVIFFVTPIFWTPDLAGDRKLLFVDSNPFFHFIELVRAPLLGQPPTLENWLFSTLILVVGTALTLVVYGRFRSRIPYWL